jgi:hypothetical protein
MQYWPALQIINQVAGETGQTQVQTLFQTADVTEVQNAQLLAALQSAGNELMLYYPWEQFVRTLAFPLIEDQGGYPLPADWAYFIDQTQWDTTNHWPLLGPKSAAEWAWLKGGLLASFPRMRYRVMGNKLEFFPVPASNSEFKMSMEYISGNWVQTTASMDGLPDAALVMADGDIVWYNPWLMVKYTKLKWLQLKGFDQSAAAADFSRMWESLKGKDTGAQVLSLVPKQTPFFIGPWSVPDGNWNV